VAAFEDCKRGGPLNCSRNFCNEVDNLIKDKPRPYKGARLTPSNARAEPSKAGPSLGAELRKKGGLIRANCTVISLDIDAGRVARVVTEHGRVAAQSVVCAGAASSTMLLANLGIKLPQLSVRATVTSTISAPDIYQGDTALREVALRRCQDSGYTVASMQRINISSALIAFDTSLSSRQRCIKVFALSNCDSVETSYKGYCQR